MRLGSFLVPVCACVSEVWRGVPLASCGSGSSSRQGHCVPTHVRRQVGNLAGVIGLCALEAPGWGDKGGAWLSWSLWWKHPNLQGESPMGTVCNIFQQRTLPDSRPWHWSPSHECWLLGPLWAAGAAGR